MTRAGARTVVALTLAVVLVAAGWRISAHRETLAVLHAALMVPAFLVPALRIGTWQELRSSWRGLAGWFLLWTLVWDGATALHGARPFFSEWWLVYSTGLAILFLLLVLHAGLVALLSRIAPPAPAGNAR